MASHVPKQQFYVQRKQNKAGAGKHDAKAFDQKLVDRALALLVEYQKMYQFAVVKC